MADIGNDDHPHFAMASSSRTLVTGFGPFLNVSHNPSAELAQSCGRPFQVLEVSFEAADQFIDRLDPESFDRLLMIGVAKGRDRITPELLAKNQIGETRDVRGRNLAGRIEATGPETAEASLWTTPVLELLSATPQIEISRDAGEYLCNYLSYRALRAFPTREVGFLHIPHPQELPLDVQMEVLRTILDVIER